MHKRHRSQSSVVKLAREKLSSSRAVFSDYQQGYSVVANCDR